MIIGSVLWWLGRIAFLAVLSGFIYELYRALAASNRLTAPRPASASPRLLLEAVGQSSEVWLKEATGEHRRLTPGADVLLREPLEIGRSPENSLRVVDPYVSARHCVLRQEGGTFIIADLGTTNGTHVDSRPVRGRSTLRSGTTIEVGRARFRFEVK